MDDARKAWLALAALGIGCGVAPVLLDAGGDASGSDTGSPATDSGVPAPSGTVPLAACRGIGGVDESCTLVLDASGCLAAPCERLVVVFSGGEQGCTGAGYTDVLAAYATLGYAAVCINYFETSVGSGVMPYVDEADRIDLAMREATTGAWAEQYWSGDDLLIEGISHGATAPPILMARTMLDDAAHWHGTRTTGACFFDGSYDQAATAENLRTSGIGGGECRLPVAYTRWLERYCGAGATSCDLTTEPDALRDTITLVDPAEYAVHDFLLVECGSGLDACREDILPAPPIEALCSTLDASPDHACTYDSLPDQSHVACHPMSFDRCRVWFEAL